MTFKYTTTLVDSANNAFDTALLKDIDAAAASWSKNIHGKGTIDIQVTVSTNTNIGTANGGPATSIYIGKNGTTSIYRGGAEYELLTGKDPNGSAPDIVIAIDPTFISKYLYLDPDPSHPSAVPSNRYDGIGVLVHEIGHGLGLTGFRDAQTGVLPRYASPWDKLVAFNADGSANFTGANAVSVFGGPVHVTTEHNAEQYYHLGSSASDPIASDVMTGYSFSPGRLYQVSNVDLGILKDLGLNVYGSAGGNPLIDALYYAKSYQDVARAHVDIATHYNDHGWHEGRNPNAFFSTLGYLAANPDVNTAGVNPLSHYAANGWKEGRDPSAAFDNELYLARNSDVKAAGIDPLSHYLSIGIFEGRQAYAAIGRSSDVTASHGFDAEYYLLANADVAQAALAVGGDSFHFALQHYEGHGWHEGRNPNAMFDTTAYLAAYADVKAAQIDPLMHYETYGWHEGRNPSATFNTHAYEAANPDVAAAQVDPMLHYLTSGALEGRLLA